MPQLTNSLSELIVLMRKELLRTGGKKEITVKATIFECEVKYKHLGVGVYNVWLEKPKGD